MVELERPDIWTFARSLQNRVASVVAALGFSLTLIWTYARVLTNLYAYMGFTYVTPDGWLFVAAIVAAVLPAFLLPLKALRPSAFVAWFVYYGLYIPAETLPVLMGKLSRDQMYELIASVALAFAIICLPPSRRLEESGDNRPFTIDSGIFWGFFGAIYIAITIWIFVAFGGHLRIVGLEDIYRQRAASSQLMENSLVGYGTGLLAGAMNPFLISLGLTRRKPIFYFIGAGGQLLVFATAAMKSVFLSIVAIPVFYFILFHKRECRIHRLGLWYFAGALGLTLAYVGIDSFKVGLLKVVFAVLYMRTFCTPGVMMGAYTEFFMSHPFTYYSHVNLFRMFLIYPYPGSLGYMVGKYLTPNWVDADANASFMATDGVAAYGFVGIIVSGILFRLILSAIDSRQLRSDVPLICCALIPGIVTLLNTSLFSSLLSGGVGMLMLLLYLHSLILRKDAANSPELDAVEAVREPVQ